MRHRPPSSIQHFLDEALPANAEQSHILALGEFHSQNEHIHYLREHLPRLARRHQLGAIGIESHILMNVFYRAYAEGCLPVPPEHALHYLKTVVKATCTNDFHANREAVVDLMSDAIALGIRPVAFDSRHVFEDIDKGMEHWKQQFEKRLTVYAQDEGVAYDDALLRLRIDDGFRDRFFEKHYSHPQERYFWGQCEAIAIMEKHPQIYAYVRALQRIYLTWAFDEGPHHVSPDYLSALSMRACMVPDKNAISISGVRHICRFATVDQHVDGYFTDYLESIALPGLQKPTVTAAMLAGVGAHQKAQEFNERTRPLLAKMRKGKSIAGLDIPNGQRFEIPRPPLPPVIRDIQLPDPGVLQPYLDILRQPWATQIEAERKHSPIERG